jgi:transcriptional regulator with XRE-family HTH domain
MSTAGSKKNFTLDWKSVGRRIRELRGFDTKQSELAEALGIAQSYISAIERGLKEPSATILYRIAKLYGKTIEWLLIGSDGNAP